MAKERLSKLQKAILTTLYELPFRLNPDSKYLHSIRVNKSDTVRIAELEAGGYKFERNFAQFGDPNTLSYIKYLPDYSLTRSKLLFSLNRWQNYNYYKPEWDGAAVKGWTKRREGLPPGFNKKQAALTRSLQILASKELVILLGNYDQGLSVYGAGFAKRLGIQPQDFVAQYKQAMKKEIEKWKKDKKANPHKTGWRAIGTFDEWWNERQIRYINGCFRGYFTHKRIFESFHNSRLQRNIKKVRLTDKGLKKAKELWDMGFRPVGMNDS